MLTGFLFVLFGVLILFYPQLLLVMLSAVLVLFGLGMMAAAWQFRRLKQASTSRFINWIVRW